ncbi:MAG: glutamate racemase [Rhizobiales bacterium]|nr:glutamate racemase [Hyphomicrobiales bacterium]
MGARPRILVFDSGLGGLTVQREIARERADADMLYVADDAAFPYGRLSEEALVARVEAVMARLIADFAPDVVVIACNTASTLVLGPLRAIWPQIAFVGTVPAVKPAALASRSGLISVLATPGTVSRDYTRRLIDEYAAHCEVTLVGSTRLASLAEAHMRGEAAPDADIAAEIAACFVEREGRRTDAVALACTHYPLLLATLTRLAPWPVAWIDPAPAIARRVAHVLAQAGLPPGESGPGARAARFTSGRAPEPALAAFLERLGLSGQATEPLPLT